VLQEGGGEVLIYIFLLNSFVNHVTFKLIMMCVIDIFENWESNFLLLDEYGTYYILDSRIVIFFLVYGTLLGPNPKTILN